MMAVAVPGFDHHRGGSRRYRLHETAGKMNMRRKRNLSQLFQMLCVCGSLLVPARTQAESLGFGEISPLLAAAWHLGLWVAGSLLAAAVTHFVWERVFLPIARRTRTKLDIMMLQATRRPAIWTVFILGLRMGQQNIAASSPALNQSAGFKIFSDTIYVILVLVLAWAMYAIIRALADWYAQEVASKHTARMDDQFVRLIRKIAQFLFVFVALAAILDHFGIRVTGLLATAGVLSLAVALAAQETLANMVAGFALMADRPFRPGDRVELANGKMGDVLEVGLRSTRILSFDNTVITIPNSEIAKNQIVNWTAPNPKLKIRTTIGVAYGTDLRLAKRVLLEVFQKHPEILKDPPPQVFFTEFAESSLNLLCVYWVADYREAFRIRDEVNMNIKDSFEAAGVQIPFPQRVVHLVDQRQPSRTSAVPTTES